MGRFDELIERIAAGISLDDGAANKAQRDALWALDALQSDWQGLQSLILRLEDEVKQVQARLAEAQEDKPSAKIKCSGSRDDGWCARIYLDGDNGYSHETAIYACRDAAMIAAFHHAALMGWLVRLD